MPKLPELVEAEAAYTKADLELKAVRTKIRKADAALNLLYAQVDEHLKGPKQVLADAKELQNRTLTRWIERYTGQFTRYRLKESGSSDLCWDRRAWLRVKSMAGLMASIRDARWAWSVDYDTPQGKRVLYVDLETNGLTSSSPIADFLAASDKLLVAAGWILTDLDNDPPVVEVEKSRVRPGVIHAGAD